ncbi:hypothetical protein GOBAR_AA24242 [Gossypium barbadense]|uniref:Uncharacterized protein n=1 Tax=Gossypium barbadense TaxID=3634 RepID=A0A2P5WZA8_GOSBA|nr:hypothetical protein GOBAR_AA24242 [Gossypium barbadense]
MAMAGTRRGMGCLGVTREKEGREREKKEVGVRVRQGEKGERRGDAMVMVAAWGVSKGGDKSEVRGCRRGVIAVKIGERMLGGLIKKVNEGKGAWGLLKT